LAPTVGTLGIGIVNSMAFLLLANGSAEVDENQEMELTIGSLSILIGPSGSSRLSDPTKQDPSASELETVAMMEYSDGSSSKVNSPVSLGEEQKEVEEDNKTKEKLDEGVQLNDLMICLDNICHDPDFFKNKNFIMHSWHISFQIFSKVLNFILQRILSNALFPSIDTQVFRKKVFYNCPPWLWSYLISTSNFF
jgi:hypothetical protein